MPLPLRSTIKGLTSTKKKPATKRKAATTASRAKRGELLQAQMETARCVAQLAIERRGVPAVESLHGVDTDALRGEGRDFCAPVEMLGISCGRVWHLVADQDEDARGIEPTLPFHCLDSPLHLSIAAADTTKRT
jgi:hypothetical protein